MSGEPAKSQSKARVRKEGKSINSSVQIELELEIMRLKRILKIEENLNLVWNPDSRNHLSGELRGKTVYIYESDLEKARETLRHEIIDYLISNAIEPYKDMTNVLIKKVNEDAYLRKEKIVKALMSLFDEMSREQGDHSRSLGDHDVQKSWRRE